MAEAFDRVKLSKGSAQIKFCQEGTKHALAWLLRHNAEKNGFKFLEGGYLPVKDILAHSRFKGFTVEQVENVVKNCEKQRFALKEENGELFIRANQISDAEDVPKAIHGTTLKAWQSIRTQGLSRMNRQHIHMSAGEPGDEGVISGMRHQSQIFIYIDVKTCLEAGLKFYRSSNNVILSPGDQEGFIKPQFFAAVKDTKLNKMLL